MNDPLITIESLMKSSSFYDSRPKEIIGVYLAMELYIQPFSVVCKFIRQVYHLDEKTKKMLRRIQKPVKHLKMQFFPEIVGAFQPLSISPKSFILDVWQVSEYASEISQIN